MEKASTPIYNHDTSSYSTFGLLFLTNLNKLFYTGSERALLQDDLGLMIDEERVSSVYKRFSSYWEEELLLPMEKRSIAKPLFKAIGKNNFICALLLQMFASASGFGPPLILKALSSHFSSIPGMELISSTLWILSVLLFIIPVTGVIFGAKSYISFSHFGCIIRSSLIPAIYKKSLRLGNNSKVKFTTGQIVNLFGNDILHIQMFIQDFAEPFFAPFQLAVALSLIYDEVGVSMFAGFGLVIVIVPLMLLCILTFVKNRNAKLLLGDDRIKLTNEVLQGIRVLKYYAWEVAFKGKVDELRVKEVEALAKMNYLIVAIVALIVMVPVFMPILIFFTYISLGNQLNATKAFTVLAYFALVQNPILLIPQLLQKTMLSYSSAMRIFNFLCCDELEPYVKTCDNSNDDNTIICVKDGHLGWLREVIEVEITEIINEDEKNNKAYTPVANVDESLEKPNLSSEGDIELIIANKIEKEVKEEIRVNRSINTLVNLNVNITKGQLVAVIGSVGSGKTSFLCGLLGELELIGGSVQCSAKSIAYHQQQPWIINDTMKANILFGKPYNEEKLQHAINAACLLPDLEILPRGIETEIGEKGITLSGGQKARVSFARTIYCESDLYLLDDPLSAVDAHVGEHIFHKGIKQALKGKTIILVTHQVHFLDMCDLVLVFKDGIIISQGSPQEIKNNGLDLENIISKPIDESITSPDEIDENKIRSMSSDSSVSDNTNVNRTARVQSVSIEDTKTEYVKIEKEKKSKDLMTEEERVSGFVKFSVYDWYFRVGGYNYIYVLLITCILTGVFYCYCNIYLADWGEDSYIRVVMGNPFTTKENLSYFSTYTLLTLVTIIGTTARIAVMVTHGIVASGKIHKNLLSSILSAPISFFDCTPLGRILNRFAADVTQTDEGLAYMMGFVIGIFFSILSIAFNICYSTNGTFILLLIPLAYFYFNVQKFFRSTNTELKRLENISRSPIFVEFNQALQGVTSLRAFKEERQFVQRMEDCVDKNTTTFILLQLAKWWLTIRLDSIGGCISFFVAALSVASPKFISAKYLGLALQNAFMITGMMKNLVNMGSQVEASMSSIERIKYYTEEIDCEEPNKIEDAPHNWPNSGEITAVDVKMRYRDGPLVLNGVNFSIKAGEKVGIAGRTGSGKSSLMVALFRMEIIEEGIISIDDIDISKISLHSLRSKVAIIPQDPVMFSATLRFNIDPFNEVEDDEIWKVLELVNMKESVLALKFKLEELVSEGGENFSSGQRQLICIARAALRKPKILVLDEATASIDNETDVLIQKMIRSSFSKCTILTIAHRLHTIIDSDRILIMDNGNVAEFDTPNNLLEKPNGLFKGLWSRHLETSQQ